MFRQLPWRAFERMGHRCLGRPRIRWSMSIGQGPRPQSSLSGVALQFSAWRSVAFVLEKMQWYSGSQANDGQDDAGSEHPGISRLFEPRCARRRSLADFEVAEEMIKHSSVKVHKSPAALRKNPMILVCGLRFHRGRSAATFRNRALRRRTPRLSDRGSPWAAVHRLGRPVSEPPVHGGGISAAASNGSGGFFDGRHRSYRAGVRGKVATRWTRRCIAISAPTSILLIGEASAGAHPRRDGSEALPMGRQWRDRGDQAVTAQTACRRGNHPAPSATSRSPGRAGAPS